jgi:hypothetical protein
MTAELAATKPRVGSRKLRRWLARMGLRKDAREHTENLSEPPHFQRDLGITGWLGEAGPDNIVGQAYRPTALNEHIRLALYDGERFLAWTVADKPRRNLIERGVGDGHYGFWFPLPPALRDGRPHELDIRIAGTAVSLLERPIFVRAAPIPSEPSA